MANSVWLHWGTREYLNKQCTVQWSDVYLQYPWHHALSLKWLLRMDAGIILSDFDFLGGGLFPMNVFWTVNNAHTLHMNTHIMGPTVVWPEGQVCRAVCQTLWYFLRHSEPISGVLWRAASKMARLGLGRWQWHTEAVEFWHTAVSNCEEKVREIRLWVSLKDMEIQPASLGYGVAQMKSLNHEYSGGEALFTAASLAFMETIMVVSSWELRF